jgi:hypothetical protein
MKYSDIKRSVLANFELGTNLVPFIVGKPGGGKSSLARSIVAELGIDPERITEFNPSLRDPVDIMGLPKTDGDHSSWLPPSEFWRIRDDGTDRPCALIVEEMSDATTPMQNPLCRVLLDRYAGELKLHPKLHIIATGNRTEDKSGATRMTTKLGNRVQTLTFDENLDDWCNWALDNDIAVEMVQFLRFRPNMLSDFDPNRAINPTPRSWEMANQVNTKLPSDLYYSNIAGLVGEGAAAEYTGFKRIFENLPNIDSIILNPSKHEVPTDMPVLFALTGALAHRVSKDNFDRLGEFIDRMPAEFQVMYTLDAKKIDPSIVNTKRFVSWAVKNANVLS